MDPIYSKIIEVLKKSKTFLLASHHSPDGDALGSILALGLALEAEGKKVHYYNRDKTPFNLAFLPSEKKISQTLPTEKVEALVMLDVAKPKRVSDEFADWMNKKLFNQWICIDHHRLDSDPAPISLVDVSAASTGVLVWKILQSMNLEISKEIATLLYTTLVVDTGFFHYSNTTEEVFDLASKLVNLGASPWKVSQEINENNPPERYTLLGEVLKSLSFYLNGAFATIELTQERLKSLKASEDLTDEFINYPRAIRGVEVAAFIKEMEDGRHKVSLRSKNIVDVSSIAKEFGGGGHKHAAGFFIREDFDAIKKILKEKIADQLV